ncbi:AAA family ATPase [Rhizobium ruizarguesonis]
MGLSTDKTVFVGANNSGKTSAITALRYFLVDRERTSFCFNDFTHPIPVLATAAGRHVRPPRQHPSCRCRANGTA